MVYNAEGDILTPFVGWCGLLDPEFAENFRYTIAFMETTEGNINLNSLCLMALFVQK